MGAYLSAPCCEKKSSDYPNQNGKYECGVSGMQGWRICMEDAYNCIPDLDEENGLFAVYDGHGGSEVAIYCALHFADCLKSTEEFSKGDFPKALCETFMNIDKQLRQDDVIKELKVLSQRDPSDPPPTEEDFRKAAEDDKEVEDETRLLYEEATMNIEAVLARYGQDVNNKEDPKEKIEEVSGSSPPQISSSKAEKKSEDDTKDKKPEEACDITVSDNSNKCETNGINQVGPKAGEKVDDEGECHGDAPALSKQSEKASEQQTKGKLVKVKPTKHKPVAAETNDDDSDDEDYLGFESDEAVEGSSSEEEEEEESDDEEEDESCELPAAIAACDDKSSAPLIEVPGSDSGTTAVVALLHHNWLYVANAGDSRCVLCRKGKAYEMSQDHKPEDEEEMERITKAGGSVNLQGRVNGGLNMSRAIGDHCYKKNERLPLELQMISAMPDVRTVELEAGDDFMVLACDGIWNVMTNEQVIEFVRERLTSHDDDNHANGEKADHKKLSAICEELFDKCLAPDTMGDGTGCDNMTCMVVRFDQSWLAAPRTNSANHNAVDNRHQQACNNSLKRGAVASPGDDVTSSTERKRAKSE